MSRFVAVGACILFLGGCRAVAGLDDLTFESTDATAGGTGGASTVAASSSAGVGAGGAGGAGGGSMSSSSSIGSGGQGGQGGAPAGFCGDGIIDPEKEECDSGMADDTCVNCNVQCGTAVEHPGTHHCYSYSSTERTWANAAANCASIPRGHLAALTTEVEIDFVKMNFLMADAVWLGANDMTVEGSFAWVTGEPWTFSPNMAPWSSGEPSGNGDCLLLENPMGPDAGRFDDEECEKAREYLCEQPPAGMKL